VFAGFSIERVSVGETEINVRRGGDGPPILLLHGYPETHVMWHRIAPRLADRFTVVCPDLRGYGDSTKPASDMDHSAYSKRAMGRDQLELMRTLGFGHFDLVGHDRGARVARRLALDHPEVVKRLALLDIVPTATIYARLNRQRATTVWRYFFLIQPFDLPERLIGADPGYYLTRTFHEWAGEVDALDPAALAEYRRCFDEPTIHASCEDYRAGAAIDLVHDQRDRDVPIACPLLVLWSARGLGASYDVRAIWQEHATEVHGRALDCGHFLAEERPHEVASELAAFFGASG
jgi:haloacetate dehalogenase